MDNVCKSADRRGNVSYGDCRAATTYKPASPPVVEDERPPAPKPVAAVTPAAIEKPPGRTLGAALSPAGAASRNTYPIAGVPLLVVGMLVALVSSINFLVGAFRAGLGGGFGSLFLWPVGFAVLFPPWSRGKRASLVTPARRPAAPVGCR